MNFYVKNDAGEFVEPSEFQLEELFKSKSEKIISKKISKEREKFRAEIDAELRKEVGETIKSDIRKELEAEYQTKVQESEAKVQKLDAQLRRKTIAIEYGFKPEAEEFLGEGTDDDMHAKADALKNSFIQSDQPVAGSMNKSDTEPISTGSVTLCP